MPKDLKKHIKINALPEEVYDALTKPFAIELWTGTSAVMSTEPNNEFEIMDGCICGMNLEFEENRKIVQEWYFGDENPQSIVTFFIRPKGTSKSELSITHTNIPDCDYDDIVEGWQECYIEPLCHFLEDEE
jgi:activator of HSP90 ATPase